ncbi:MAG: hypothetical protein ACJAVK_003227, partial [Akkermansiaceae bacterium]
VVDQQAAVAGDEAHACHGFDAPFGIEVVGGEILSREDVPPVAMAVEGAAGFIGVGDGALHEGLTDGLHRGGSFLGAAFDEVGEGAFAERGIEKLTEKFAQTPVGQKLWFFVK